MTERFTALLSRDKSTEQERHELAVIDAAVRGAGTDQPEDAALTDFALRISAARALPNDGFYRELDERFGIADSAAPTAPPGARRRFSLLATGGGVLASLVLVIVVVSGVKMNDAPKSSSTAIQSNGGSYLPPASPNADSRVAEGTATGTGVDRARVKAPAATQDLATAAPGSLRKVARTGDLVLATPGGNVETVADGVIGVTDKFGGFVGNSTVTGGDANNATANFELQIPADRFQPALAQLSKLAHVRSRTQATQDVTAPYSRARSRLTIARAKRDRLAAQFAAATPGSREAAVLRTRLAHAESRVDARRADLSRLQNRVNFVGMTVGVVSDATAVVADGRGTLHRAVDTAARLLTAIAAILLIVSAVALPIAMIAGLVWLTNARISRRRRNAALDGSAAQ